MRRLLAAIMVTCTVVSLLLATGILYTYGSPYNSGIVVGAFGHCAGLEIAGSPGFFTEVDCV